jgi:diguanylate cyclase (GGDEF)-like protein
LIRHNSDWLARYGGEEFLLVLPETKLDNALRLAERLRQHLAQKAIETKKVKISITASFGVTGFDASHINGSISSDRLLNTVDRYLYEAKTQGRNRVVCGPYPD